MTVFLLLWIVSHISLCCQFSDNSPDFETVEDAYWEIKSVSSLVKNDMQMKQLYRKAMERRISNSWFHVKVNKWGTPKSFHISHQ